ncbi:hypothetical protein L218DRAFT_996166 [Marasmius fiardii PR-910]|nr:hypothetical protein L218DRAFT_996166 [Marasmius fiardii PR-910]
MVNNNGGSADAEVSSDKGKHVKYPHGFEAHSSEDWQGFMDDMENTFCVKGVVSREAKIYLALQRRSWEKFKEEVFEQWDVDIKFGSLSKLKKIVRIHQGIDNNTSDETLALLSNHSLVEIYLSAFSDRMIEKILHSLQLKLAAKLENEDATMKERWRQDPWLLEEVMEQAEVTVKSGIGGTYTYGLAKNSRSLPDHSRRQPSSSSESGSKQRVWFEEPSRGLAGLTSLATSASEAAKIWVENPNIKFEDEETMFVKSTIDGHGPSQSFAQSAGPRPSNSLSWTGSAPPARTGGICYMCNGQGHISTECDWQKEYIKRGWIKIDPKSGRWVLKDRTPMPYQKEEDPDPQYSKIERIAREANWDGPSEAGGSDPSSAMYLMAEPPTESFYQGNSLEASSNDIVLGNEDADLLDNIMQMFINAKYEAKKQSTESKN